MARAASTASAAFLLFFTSSAPVQAQDAATVERPAGATAIESFISRKGILILKEFHKLGALVVRGHEALFEAVVASEPGSNARALRGIKVTVTEDAPVERSHTSFLDIEEADSLLTALEYLSGVASTLQAAELTPEQRRYGGPYREAVFATKDDFRVGVAQRDDGTLGIFISSGRIGQAKYVGRTSDLEVLKGYIARGLEIAKATNPSQHLKPGA